MVVIPFIFFLLLTIYLWIKHKGLDVCVFISALYTFTSLLAIIIVAGDMLDGGGVLFDETDIQLNLLPTLCYCFFITIGIMPFSLVYKKDLKNITVKNPLVIHGLSVFLICIALLNLYLVADSTVEILSGDFSTIRNDHYNGLESPAEIKAQGLPYILRFLYYFNASTILALPLAFYYLCFRKHAGWFAALLFATSLSMPIQGIQVADRTEIAMYALMFLSCLILFHPHLSPKIKMGLRIATIPVGVAAIIYFAAVSDSRFKKTDGGAETSAIQYAGQGYLNFCFFWENGKWEYASAEREFPLISHYLFHVDNSPLRRSERSGEQGFFMSVFASYIGDVLLDLTPFGMVIWCVLFFFICMILFRRPHREELSIEELLAFFVLSIIPTFGIFYYRFMSYPHTYMLLLVAAVFVLDRYKIKC